MSENGKLVPKRRFKEFQNADAWEQRELRELATMNARIGWQNLRTSEFLDSGDYMLITGTDFKDGEIDYSNIHYVEKKRYDQDKKIQIQNNSILITKDGTLGKVAYVERLAMPATLNAGVFNVKVKEGGINVDSKYLFHYLKAPFLLKYANAQSTGGTIKHLNQNVLVNFPIPLPAIDEQVKIGAFFKQLDDSIAFQQRKLEKMKSMKSAYLSEMFPADGERKPKRRFPGFTDAWEQRELGELGKTFTGLSGKTKEDFGHGEGKFITYMNVFSNSVADLNGLESVEIDKKQFEVRSGDVLFTTSSETPEEVGMSSVWLGNADNVYLNSFCFGYRPTVKFDNYYLAFMLRSDTIRKKLQLLAQGISRYNISKNKVMEMSIPVPNIEEQKVLGVFFKNLDQTIAFQQQKLEKLQNIKKAYLNEMFI